MEASTVILPADTTAAPADSTVAVAPSLKSTYADWPQYNDQRAQPWDLQAVGVSREDRDKLLDNPGTPDTVSPIVISHSMPILSSGSGGDQAVFVKELARRLSILGYQTNVGTSSNPFGTLDDTIMGSVERFREEHNVQEDPTAYGGNTAAGRDRANVHVGPWTWEAIIRASEAKLASEQ